MTSDTELSSFIGKQHDFVSSTVWVDKKEGMKTILRQRSPWRDNKQMFERDYFWQIMTKDRQQMRFVWS